MALLELRDVTKTFHLGQVEVRALRGVSLDIERGEWAAIMGPSGCGKSTLMSIIGCLDSPTGGTYSLDDKEVASLDEDALSAVRNERIGFVFQSFHLLPRIPALEQVMLPLQYLRDGRQISSAARAERAREVLEMVGLGERADHDPSELSGGERQRVAIARALVNRPRIVLADEPTGNLDSRSGAEIMAIFERLHEEEGLTLLMVTHEDDIARRAKRIIKLRDGRIEGDQVVDAATQPPQEAPE